MATKQSNGPVKWLTIISAIILIAAGGVWYFKHGHNDAPQYQTTTVTRGDLMQAVTASGTLNPVVNVTVGCQVSGRISKLYVDFNSPVTNGQLIAEIDPRTYQAAMEQATADLANSKANLELQQAEANRALELFTNKLISQADRDTTIANLHEADAMVKIKTAALSNALANLSYCKVYSPVDGTVISRSVDVGQTVAASMSAPVLFQIANDLAKMQIDANVSEADIGSVEEGQNVSFTVDAFPDRKFAGKVRQIRNSPTTVQNVVTYDVVIEVANPDLKLRPGMTANASLITAERSDVLKIPNAALRFRPPDAVSKGIKPAATNATQAAKTGGTNGTEVAANTAPPLTGNEPPEELQKRVSEMRARGEEIPPEIRTKLRELYQSGALQRPGGGGGGFGGGPGFGGGALGGGRGGGGFGARGPQSSSRTVYTFPADKNASDPTPQAVRVKTGISDGNSTEIIDGLNEGDTVIIGVILPQTAAAAPPPGGASPFGGGGMGGGGFRGGGR
jgi:HlyD family secretion protein